MVLNDILYDSVFVIIVSSSFYAYFFSHGYFYRINMFIVPDWFKCAVGKAQECDSAHQFFSQIMVYAVDVFLFEYVEDLFVDFFCRCQIPPKWLFVDKP